MCVWGGGVEGGWRGCCADPRPARGERTPRRARGGCRCPGPAAPRVREDGGPPLQRCGIARGYRTPRTPPGLREPASRALQTRLLTANFKDRRKSYKVSLLKCLIYKLDCYTINQKVN